MALSVFISTLDPWACADKKVEYQIETTEGVSEFTKYVIVLDESDRAQPVDIGFLSLTDIT
jgi:hypothetical protein